MYIFIAILLILAVLFFICFLWSLVHEGISDFLNIEEKDLNGYSKVLYILLGGPLYWIERYFDRI